MGRKQRRYSWAVMWEVAERQGHNIRTLAAVSGVDVRDLYRHRDRGSINETHADRLATGLGFSPCAVWPEWLDDGIASDRRRLAEKQRRYRQRNPDYAERQRAYRRAYYAESRAYELARQRRYDAANSEAIAAKRRNQRRERAA